MVSLTSSPQWLLGKWPQSKGFWPTDDPRRVAFINTFKMKRLGVYIERSNTLAIETKISRYSEFSIQARKGVKYTSAEHSLAHGWIPPHCTKQI